MNVYEIQYIDKAGRLAAVTMQARNVVTLVERFVDMFAPVTVINSIVRLDQ